MTPFMDFVICADEVGEIFEGHTSGIQFGRLPSASRMFFFFLLLLLLSTIDSRAGAQSPIALPPCEWVRIDGTDAGFFRKTFSARSGLQKAVLLGACAGRMTAWVNGERIGEFSGREQAESFDVSRHVHAGANVLAVEAAGASIALILELVFDSGRHEWIVTDGSWLGSARAGADWQPVAALGRVDAKAEGNPFDPRRAVDAYNSWTLARGAERATDPATIVTLPGFTVELLRSAQAGEDSWVALAFDPRGRITVALEKKPGLLRLTLGAAAVEKVEVINDTLLECRGLLYAHGALYAYANKSSALFRLRDAHGDDRFEEVRELVRTEGGAGHGRNHLRLGPDGMIYILNGDDVALPAGRAADSPFQRFAGLPWIPGPRDAQTFGTDGRLLSGYLARTDGDGTRWEIVAGGLRNSLALAFNEDGEMFTYEADNERDIGNPWYLPTRVHHLVSGGEYGWRRGTVVLPPYAAEVLPAIHDVGLGSPTGVEFGTRCHFPEKYRRALFIADWAYGRILAVHLAPHGASYSATREDFATGRPLNITDLTTGPDGALYFTTGGRGTQSGLYRLRYTGKFADGPRIEDTNARAARELRHRLEAFHRRDRSTSGAEALAAAWPQLGHEDRWIRFAARLALETVNPREWQEKALAETESERALTAWLALARVGSDTAKLALLDALNRMSLSGLGETQQLEALRIYELILPALPEVARSATAKLDPLYPASSRAMNRELCKLLVNLGAPGIVARTTRLLSAADDLADVVHFLFFLRHAREPWTIEERRIFFTALRRAEQGQGAQNYVATLRQIKAATASALTDAERTALAPLIEDKSIVLAALAGPAPHFVREWSMETLEPLLDRAAAGRSFTGGRAAFAAAQCILCHRVGTDPGGLIGPDLTAVASRFGRRDILDAILDPSRAIDDKFRNTVIGLKSGETLLGVVETETAGHVTIRPDPLAQETKTIRVKDIASRELSAISPMPPSLLNMLEREQILDLLAYLESGGNPEHPAFRPAPRK